MIVETKKNPTHEKYSLKGCDAKELSAKTGINILRILYLIYFPYAKIKLTEGIRISKVLGINVCQLI